MNRRLQVLPLIVLFSAACASNSGDGLECVAGRRDSCTSGSDGSTTTAQSNTNEPSTSSTAKDSTQTGQSTQTSSSGQPASTFDTWHDCGEVLSDQPKATKSFGQCMCDAVKDCKAGFGKVWLDFGSENFRVCGVRGSTCFVSVFVETEGFGQGYSCTLTDRSKLCSDHHHLRSSEILQSCQETYSCNILMGDCPKTPDACSAEDR